MTAPKWTRVAPAAADRDPQDEQLGGRLNLLDSDLTRERQQPRKDLNAEARIQAGVAHALDEIRDLLATAAGYVVSIERCAERGSTARFAFELRQVLACLSERVESLNRAGKPEGAQ
jgi:hypothetical protein